MLSLLLVPLTLPAGLVDLWLLSEDRITRAAAQALAGAVRTLRRPWLLGGLASAVLVVWLTGSDAAAAIATAAAVVAAAAFATLVAIVLSFVATVLACLSFVADLIAGRPIDGFGVVTLVAPGLGPEAGLLFSFAVTVFVALMSLVRPLSVIWRG